MTCKTAIIIGAGPAGLACAGALKMRGAQAVVLEKGAASAPVWRNHYDRLNLHTAKRYSSLPGFSMPRHYPTYPSRDQVVAYLEDYIRHHGIEPEFGTEVTAIVRDDQWQVITRDGVRKADRVIVACGFVSFPHFPSWPGLDGFTGLVLHSSHYKNPSAYSGKRMLVVGFGNSAGEIAMDLAEAGIRTALSVRGPVNVVPRDVMGIPSQAFAIAERRLPYKLVDVFNGAVSRLRMGDISKLGLSKSSKGPMAQVIEDGRQPLIDIGTLACIRDGSISVHGGISRIEGGRVHFVRGESEGFDAIVLATGYRPDLRSLLPDHGNLLDRTGAPRNSGAKSGAEGLFFCGYTVVATGHLREIGIEAIQIAEALD